MADGFRSTFTTESFDTQNVLGMVPLCFLNQSPEDLGTVADYTLAYFEVKILLGGFYDQVAVGFTSDAFYSMTEFAGYQPGSIAYHGDEGQVFTNGVSQVYGPRFGSHDTVGVGVTRSGDIFFTLNGLLL